MAAEEGTLSVIIDKVSFLKQVPWLLKATADDENPTPGYMYKEICDISLASGSYCQTLLDYLLDRLEKDSCQVKLKVLRILQYIVQNGHPDFRQGLRRRPYGIQQASKYSGPPDPLHGNTQYTAVRAAAQSLSQLLFDVSWDDNKIPGPQTDSVKMSGGMGASIYGNKMQGFGNVPNKPNKTLGETLMSGIKDLADRVTDSTDPRWSSYQADPFRQGDYRPVLLPTSTLPASQPEWEKPVSCLSRSDERIPKKPRNVPEHRPGVAGGGWEDDPPGEVETSLRKSSSSTLRLASDGHSSDSLNSSSTPITQSRDISERLEEVRIEDWHEEERLVMDLVVNCPQFIPPRDKVNTFLKRCDESNVEMIIIFLSRYLQPDDEQETFRALLLIDFLMKSDNVTIDHIVSTSSAQLVEVYKKAHGQTKAKARKVIRQLQLLSGQIDLFAGMPPMPRFETKTSPSNDSTHLDTNGAKDGQQPYCTNKIGSASSLDTLNSENIQPSEADKGADVLSDTRPGLLLPILPSRSGVLPHLQAIPGCISSDSSPEWPSLQIPFAGSLNDGLSNSGVEECPESGAKVIDIQAEDCITDGRKDSSMSEDSLKDDDGAFDFLSE